MTRLLALLSLVAACGWPPPPETVSIDPAFSALERAAILDGIDQWCQSVEWCPRVVARGAEGRYVLDESVLDGITSVVDGKPIVKLAPHALVANGGENDLWRVAVHETGHFGAEHNDRGIMAAVATMPYEGPLCLDDAAVQLWCAAQGCAHTKGTCR